VFILRVSDLETAQSQFYDWADHIISLLDPETAACWPRQHERHLIVGIDDIETSEPGLIAPETDHVDAILAFARSIRDDEKLIVHCHAGVSRSTATAIAVLISHGRSIEGAFEEVRTQRGERIWPNQRLIELYDDKLCLNGDLVAHVQAWKHTQRNILEQRSDIEATIFLSRLKHLNLS